MLCPSALRDTHIVIDGSKTVAIDPKAGPVDYDLRGLDAAVGTIDPTGSRDKE